jgi:hypothetical protein
MREWDEYLYYQWSFIGSKRIALPVLNQAPRYKDAWESEIIAPRILNLGTTWKWVVRFTPRRKSSRYALDRVLGGPQSRSGGGCEEKNSLLLLGIERRSSSL